MAFTSHTQAKRAARAGGDVPVLMRVDDVNVQAGSLTCTVTREENPDNPAVEPGQYTVQMDTQAIPIHKRQQSAERATGSFYGGLIGEKMERKKGQHLLAEGFHVTAPGQATARWLNSTRAALTENRAGLVHTRQVKRNGQDFIETSGMTILDTEAFDIWEGGEFSERMRETLTAADANFERGTVPNNKRDSEGRVWMWSSMPSTSMMFAVLDKQAQQVVETTTIYNRNPDPAPEDYPDYLGAEDRLVQTPRGPRKRSLPLNAEKFSVIANDFTQYAREKYQGQDIALIAVRGTRTEASRQKDPRNFDMHSSASDNRPVTVCHKESQAAYRLDPLDDEATQKGLAFVRTAAVRFARNTGDTYSKFATYKHSFPETGRHFLHYIRYQGQPMNVHPALSTPINAQGPSAEHNAQAPGVTTPEQPAGSQQPLQGNSNPPPVNQQSGNPPADQPQQPSPDAQRESAQPDSTTPQDTARNMADDAPRAPEQVAGSGFEVVDHDAKDTARRQPVEQEAPASAPAEEHGPRLQGFIDASGGDTGTPKAPHADAMFPTGEDFEDGGEPAWLNDFNEETSLEENGDHGIDTSNNPADSKAPVRSTKFDMPFSLG